MVDFITGTSSLLVTFLLLAGYFGLAALVLFEAGAVFLFWVKDVYLDESKKLVQGH